MLIEFSVTNFKSINETQTLSLVASSDSEMREQNTFASPEQHVPNLLRSAVVYGPNASGKSNIMEALHFMDRFVRKSAKEGQEGDAINAKPFLFSASTKTEPSEFEVLFLHDEVRYQYGFSVNQTRVVHEWLIAYPEGRPQRWFERSYSELKNKKGEEIWYFGSKFKGRKSVLQEATRSNALFLSTAVQLNNESLKPVYNWFHHVLRVVGVGNISLGYSVKRCESEIDKKRVLDFMNAADLSIVNIEVESKPFDSSELPPDMPNSLKEVLRKDMDGKEISEIKFFHKMSETGELVALNLDEESVGTKKFFSLSGPWLDILDNGRVLFVDELNNSMHPLMVRFLVSLINNPEVNKKNAQLIFSTHDTSTLDKDIFRRDQIWFTEKNASNATNLYPLTDFSPRKGEALQKGYLQGRYGALPFIGELRI